MTAVLSPSPSPTSSSHQTQSPPGNSNSPLPPLVTNHPTRREVLQRPQSYARNRMSSYSATSNPSQNRSRPASHAFPTFHSSLPYALVRDFAYPIISPYHYGPPPETSGNQSGNSTPASEFHRRLSDPSTTTWDGANPQWSAGPWGGDGFFASQPLSSMAYGDGPPYSEDEDLHSPVVVSSRHKKSKSTFATFGASNRSGRSPGPANETHGDGPVSAGYDKDRGYFTGTNGDGSETYYISEADESANGPGGELVTYPPDPDRQSLLAPNTYTVPGQRDSHFATTLTNRSYVQEPPENSDDETTDIPYQSRDSRYSKDYQFTIASPDEEMHGKAVALFDFARENENELPLIEGQVIWVSYRHGQGWLVAEDPKTRESGLVPEEYVRLLRDIEGGLTSLSGELAEDKSVLPPVSAGPSSAATSAQTEPGRTHSAHPSNGSNAGTEKRPPVVSTFSTSSKDLSPYPHRLLGSQAGQAPPPVVHYGSQSSTPTHASPPGDSRRGFGELKGLSMQKEEEDEDQSTRREDTRAQSQERVR